MKTYYDDNLDSCVNDVSKIKYIEKFYIFASPFLYLPTL